MNTCFCIPTWALHRSEGLRYGIQSARLLHSSALIIPMKSALVKQSEISEQKFL